METMSLPEKYSNDEMERILQRALAKTSSANVSREQLMEVAKELGLSDAAIEQAIHDEIAFGGVEEAKQEWLEKRRADWRSHLLWYVGVNVLTMGLNFMQEDGHFTWALWMLFGWGIGMVSDTVDAFFPNQKKLEKGVRKILRKRGKYNELGE